MSEAAERLGITEEAVRMRIKRGTLRSERRDGRVFVTLGPRRPDDQTTDRPDEPNALISAKDETIAVLREQLEAERQAHAEARRLLAAALERIPPQLEAPSEARESSETIEDAPDRAEPRSGTEGPHSEATDAQRPWWRKLFGG